MRRAVLALGLTALAALATYAVLSRRAPEPAAVAPAPQAQGAQPGAAPAAEAATQVPVVTAEHSADRALLRGETLALDFASLQKGRPVALRLDLELPSRTDEPRRVRVYAPDAQVFQTQARLDAARREASLEIDPDFLLRRPGRYVVEIETTEAAVFPIRRFALELR